jgi:Cupin-like domain
MCVGFEAERDRCCFAGNVADSDRVLCSLSRTATCFLQYRICCEAYPEWEPLYCEALDLACRSKEDWALNAHGFSASIRECVFGMVSLVEHMYLSAEFPGCEQVAESFHVPEELRPKRAEAGPGWWCRLREVVALETLPRAVGRILPFAPPKRVMTPVEDDLPVLAIDSSRMRRPVTIAATNDLDACLALVNDPVVYTASALKLAKLAAADVQSNRYRYSLDQLAKSCQPVEVRVSPSNVFVFCRSAHSLIDSGAFSSPSVLRKMCESEFASRCVEAHEDSVAVAPVAFESGSERVYMQSLLPLSETLLERRAAARPELAVTQLERVWVSTKGCVSALHYDASHSVLVQVHGRKRMLFFPPALLPTLGVYPLGHPLHRRARVDLTEGRCAANAALFREFWAALAADSGGDCGVVEVVLEPGDACTFPPGWAHYTESLDFSVSHTFRFTAAKTTTLGQ